MKKTKKKNARKYTGVLQYFHNYEHDQSGRTHCTGPKSNPYTIKHSNGKHIISLPYAKGHGRGGKTQWFRFTRRLGGGYNMASGVKCTEPTKAQKKGRIK